MIMEKPVIDFSKWNPQTPTPAKAQQTEKKESWEELTKQYRIDLTQDYPEPNYLIKIGDVPTIPTGDIQAIKAKSKNGKSYVASIFAAAILGNVEFGLSSLTDEASVLYFDTEQNPRNTARIVRRIHQLCEWSITDNSWERFQAFSLRGYPASGRLELILHVVDEFQPAAIFIDGIADLVASCNDEETAVKLMDDLGKLANDYDCAVIGVLHTNKAADDNNMKGHLGTMLLQKSSDVFHVLKDDAVFNVDQTDTRNAPTPSFSFALDDAAIPVPVADKEQRERKRMRDAYWIFFEHSTTIKATTAQITQWTEKYFDCKERKAKELIKQAVEWLVLTQPERGVYKLLS